MVRVLLEPISGSYPFCTRWLGLAPVFCNRDNPLTWMFEAIDLKKEKNLFETSVIEYQNGGALSWGLSISGCTI